MKFAALVAGAALALVPSGTALAGETGSGNAYGNCGNSSAGGVREPIASELRPAGSKGNGGLQALRGVGCTSPTGGGTPPAVAPVEPTPIDRGFDLN